MTFVQLKYFRTAAYCGSFSEASEVLFVSQPGISKAIRELEKELGMTLFRRSRNKVTLTHLGRYLYDKSEAVMADMEQLERDLSVRRSVDRAVRVATTVLLSEIAAKDIFVNFTVSNRQPQLCGIYSNADSIRRSLANGSTDVALVTVGKPISENCRVVCSTRRELMLCVSERHPLAGGGPVPFDRVAEEHLVFLCSILNGEDGLYQLYKSVNNVSRVNLHGCFMLPQLSKARRLVLESGYVLPAYRGSFPQGGGIVELSFSPALYDDIAIVCNDRREVADKLPSVIDYIREYSGLFDAAPPEANRQIATGGKPSDSSGAITGGAPGR